MPTLIYLPEGVPPELTVSELEEMACRQQQQIDSQRQLLAAKEQRLRFLKQHEAKHQQVAIEHERLRRLRDRVEAQEQKLRKLRQLRGQVDQTKLNNVSLTSDLESIRALFNEKEKELSVAVAKVEELTLQLEELQRGRNSNSAQMPPSSAAVELEKLRAELLYRNKLNEQQSARLSHQREVLAQRQEEMSAIDRRIAELQGRLQRKRLLNQQLASHISKQGNQNVPPNHQQQPQFQPIFQQPVSQQQNKQQAQIKHQQAMQMQKQPQQKVQPAQNPYAMYYQMNALTKNGNATMNKNTTYPGMTAVPKTTSTMGRPLTNTNIAAVEPYHHVPSSANNHYQPALDVKRNHRKGDQSPHQQQQQHLQQQQQQLQQHQQHQQYQQQQQHQQQQHQHQQHHHHQLTNSSSSNSILDVANHQRNKSSYHPVHHNQKEINSMTCSNDPDQQRTQPSQFSSDDERRQQHHHHQQHQHQHQQQQMNNKYNNVDNNNSSDGCKSDDRVLEFWPNKFDSKYQTLPSGTKFSVASSTTNTKYIVRRPAEGVESHDSNNQKLNIQDSTRKYSAEDNFNNNVKDSPNISTSLIEAAANDKNNNNNNSSNADTVQQKITATNSIGGAGNQSTTGQMQQTNIVRSIPISSSNNKGLATPLSNINYLSRSTTCSTVGNTTSRSYDSSNQSPNAQNADTSSSSASATSSSTVVTFTSTYQKPVSSVSPIYQTTSTRIQLVQPQIVGPFASAAGHEYRKNYLQNVNNAISDNQTLKPALPPKPAPPVKATPPPPPRQSAFHTQFTSQTEGSKSEARTYFGADFGRRNENASDNHSSSGSDKEQSDKRHYSKANVDLANDLANLNMTRNDSSKKSESPPPLPSVEPPSDDEIDRSTMKLKTIYVQNSTTNNRNKDMNRVHLGSISDRLMSDLSQDSSSSDTSSAENNYFVGTNRRIELPPAYLFPENETPPRDLVSSNSEKDVESSDDADHRNIILNIKNSSDVGADNSSDDKFSPISSSPDSENTDKIVSDKELQYSDDIKKIKKGNLKNTNSVNSKRRVSFDPLALLLDASLEGELELVKRTASQVKNPSAANDEGITALHNAICAGHFEIVQFLVEFGCDVNAQDSDGWTPLHCAASCNNLPMVRFLVEHGACIFATTLSDQETAAEKCEEDEEGFDGCSEFLYSVQEKLGILNNGIVYAVFDYEAHNPDELNFKEGDRLTVLRKGDEWEREWWWSRLNDKEGYIPRNLLGLYPRIHPNTNKIQD
ncbi:apoptosis-stimulating of p53 protein 2 isoform X3 [Planococcus citri]|uniref:apoptosis-stimulating of p53 protein 2 isoform X3 n=1 Tax=Planococcus citri TaxID=170843 RepID=UPI0031F8AF10